MPDYRYIAIEGNIGAGKTSFAARFANDTGARLVLEQFADNPFLPKFYEDSKRFAFPLELSFMAERYRQLKMDVESRDLFQPDIIADYVFYKCLIFASVNLEEDEVKLYKTLFNIIYQNLPQPDIMLFLHCPVPKLLENIKKRGRPYEQDIKASYLEAVQEMYFEFFRQQQNHSRILILNTAEIDFISDPLAYTRMKALFNKDYEPGIHFVELS